jgi:prolyl 4-hydroxylase
LFVFSLVSFFSFLLFSFSFFRNCNSLEKYKCENQRDIKTFKTFQLEVISTKPKLFLIKNLLSKKECEELQLLAIPSLEKSKISIKVSSKNSERVENNNVRTSSNAWIERYASPITQTIFRRIASILKIPESLLFPTYNAEHLQVVRYHRNEKYNEHYDWSQNGRSQCRFVTLLLYVNDRMNDTLSSSIQPDAAADTDSSLDFSDSFYDDFNPSDEEEEEMTDEDEDDEKIYDPSNPPLLYKGGETAFIKIKNEKYHPEGIAIHPGIGNAILFYNLLEDGNGDELTLHASLPVIKGTKWLANLWIWDPVLNG